MILRSTRAFTRVELFDRSMTVATQLFTSIFPILILLATWATRRGADRIADAVTMPEQSRAMTRAFATIWDLPRPKSTLRSVWRWVAAVLGLVASLLAVRGLSRLVDAVPPAGVWPAVVAFLGDAVVALFVPWVLFSGRVRARLLLPGALIAAVVNIAVRPAAVAWFPTALEHSADRYGSIGVAFTYLRPTPERSDGGSEDPQTRRPRPTCSSSTGDGSVGGGRHCQEHGRVDLPCAASEVDRRSVTVMTETTDQLGPVDWIVVEFAGSKFNGKMAPALKDLVDRDLIRVLDLLLLKKDESGEVEAFEISDMDASEVGELRSYEAELAMLLSAEDVTALAAAIEPNSSAAVLVWENTWAARFASAVRESGGQLVASGRIPVQAIAAVLEAEDDQMGDE